VSRTNPSIGPSYMMLTMKDEEETMIFLLQEEYDDYGKRNENELVGRTTKHDEPVPSTLSEKQSLSRVAVATTGLVYRTRNEMMDSDSIA
jgi:hypothetical protein